MMTIIGNIIEQTKNCACGKIKEGYCKDCKTEAMDIITLKDVETMDEGNKRDDGIYHIKNWYDNIHKEPETIKKVVKYNKDVKN